MLKPAKKLQHPQVILLDLNIPEMDGIQIQKYIQEHHLRCYTIVVSCNDEFATVKDVMRYGAYDFLRKLNLTPEALTSVLLRCKKEIEKPELQDESIRYNPPGHSAYEALFTSKNKSEIFLRGYGMHRAALWRIAVLGNVRLVCELARAAESGLLSNHKR